MLDRLLTQFLDHLRYERNVSAHTLRNYESDLRQFLDYLAPIETGEGKASKRSSRPEGKKRTEPAIDQIDHVVQPGGQHMDVFPVQRRDEDPVEPGHHVMGDLVRLML